VDYSESQDAFIYRRVTSPECDIPGSIFNDTKTLKIREEELLGNTFELGSTG
jgi:hypothetical protein